tara:strand:+ start:2185 stop:2367 length:183 start_codon:yes stop_codon:yes gene_type:complete
MIRHIIMAPFCGEYNSGTMRQRWNDVLRKGSIMLGLLEKEWTVRLSEAVCPEHLYLAGEV